MPSPAIEFKPSDRVAGLDRQLIGPAGQSFIEPSEQADPVPADSGAACSPELLAITAMIGLAGCGGGAGGSTATGGTTGGVAPTAKEATRFLAQSATGASPGDLGLVQQMGYDAWLAAQLATPTPL